MSDGSFGFNEALQYLLTGGAGVVGQGMRHLHMVQTGKRKPWLWTTFDMMIALGIGWVVLGLGEWFGVPWKATQSLSILAGWGGPHLIDLIIASSVNKYLGRDGTDDGSDKA